MVRQRSPLSNILSKGQHTENLRFQTHVITPIQKRPNSAATVHVLSIQADPNGALETRDYAERRTGTSREFILLLYETKSMPVAIPRTVSCERVVFEYKFRSWIRSRNVTDAYYSMQRSAGQQATATTKTLD